MDEINVLWAKYSAYKETAEQHEFPRLLVFDMAVEPLYTQLQENYDEHTAYMFKQYMNRIFKSLGIEVEDNEYSDD